MKNFSILLILLLVEVCFSQKQRFSSVVRTNRLTTAPYYVEIDYPSNLPGLIARYRADSLQTIIDNSSTQIIASLAQGRNAADPAFNGTVFQWRDISYRDTNNDGINDTPNNNHLVAYNNLRTATQASASPDYVFNTITNPPYRTNAKVRSNAAGGLNDFLYKDINPDLNGSFTFIFVMTANNAFPGTYNSFIASSTGHRFTSPRGPNREGAWQISTTNNVSNIYFGYNNNSGTQWLQLIPYDTQIHVYYIQYNNNNRNLRIEVDGVLEQNVTVPNNRTPPTIEELRLFRNRNLNTYILAEFHEFFLSDEIFTSSQKQLLTNYLLAKWGI